MSRFVWRDKQQKQPDSKEGGIWRLEECCGWVASDDGSTPGHTAAIHAGRCRECWRDSRCISGTIAVKRAARWMGNLQHCFVNWKTEFIHCGFEKGVSSSPGSVRQSNGKTLSLLAYQCFSWPQRFGSTSTDSSGVCSFFHSVFVLFSPPSLCARSFVLPLGCRAHSGSPAVGQ